MLTVMLTELALLMWQLLWAASVTVVMASNRATVFHLVCINIYFAFHSPIYLAYHYSCCIHHWKINNQCIVEYSLDHIQCTVH